MKYASYGLILLELAGQCHSSASGGSLASNSRQATSSSTPRIPSNHHRSKAASHIDGNATILHINTARNESQITTVANNSVGRTPTTGTGLAYASSCNNAKQSWVQTGGLSFVSTTVFQTSTSTVSDSLSVTGTTITDLSSSATLFTLCDGYPRLSANVTTSDSVVNYESTIWSTFATTTSVFASVPAPDCTIGRNECAVLQSSYSERIMTAPPMEPFPPICGPAKTIDSTFSLGQPVCGEQFASVQLLYWPVTTAADCNLCSIDKCRTTTMSQTIPGQANTFVFHNVTLTSPTVYMALSGTFVYTRSGTLVSRDSELILPQSATAVSSVCGQLGSKGGELITRSFNFADLAGLNVPAEAYRCQPRCYTNPLSYSYSNYTYTARGYTQRRYTYTGWTSTFRVANYDTWATVNQCSTIYDDYRPVLSIPAEFSSLAPAVFVESLPGIFGGTSQFTCQFYFNSDAVFFDPPMALTQAAEAAAATLPAFATLFTATTGADGLLTRPVQTASPEGTPTWSGPKETGRPGAGGTSFGTGSGGSGSQADHADASPSGMNSGATHDVGSANQGSGASTQQNGASRPQQQQQPSSQQHSDPNQGSAGNSAQSPSSPQQHGSNQGSAGTSGQSQPSPQQEGDSADPGQNQPGSQQASSGQILPAGSHHPPTATSTGADGRPLGDDSTGSMRGSPSSTRSGGVKSNPAQTSDRVNSSSAILRAGNFGCVSGLGLVALVSLLGMVVL
jgi:hypothetical protein